MKLKVFKNAATTSAAGSVACALVEHEGERAVQMFVRGERALDGLFQVATVTMRAEEARALAAQLLKVANEANEASEVTNEANEAFVIFDLDDGLFHLGDGDWGGMRGAKEYASALEAKNEAIELDPEKVLRLFIVVRFPSA